jgi:NAD(P)H dehydrogenase (quinone)
MAGERSVTDLQASGFEAVASAADFGARAREDYLVYGLEQRHAWQRRSIDPDIAAEVAAVQDADLLVLVFPIFWFSVPALMKGWIDRVFLSGVFYGGRKVHDRAGSLTGLMLRAALPLRRIEAGPHSRLLAGPAIRLLVRTPTIEALQVLLDPGQPVPLAAPPAHWEPSTPHPAG